jgi:hypothetical protein
VAQISGPENDVRTMSDNDELVITCVPSLVAVLLRREMEKGSPLTEPEVVQMRDGCEAIAMPRDVVAKVAAARGYEEIDPERCWEEWQRVRAQLHQSARALDESQQ